MLSVWKIFKKYPDSTWKMLMIASMVSFTSRVSGKAILFSGSWFHDIIIQMESIWPMDAVIPVQSFLNLNLLLVLLSRLKWYSLWMIRLLWRNLGKILFRKMPKRLTFQSLLYSCIGNLSTQVSNASHKSILCTIARSKSVSSYSRKKHIPLLDGVSQTRAP